VIDKDREGALQRVFICPGAHKHVLDATLCISHNDAFHVKTHIINSNIAATSLLTNQRTNFLYSAAIFPVENVENWTWYMRCLDNGPLGEWLHSGKAIVMGDREKGESNAVHAVFEETLGASCTHHIKKNMLAQKIPCRKENRHIWYNVATVASLAERDEWWDMLKSSEPVQAAYLQDIDRAAWQNSERIARGFMTHFTTTNNVAEQVGQLFCKEELQALPIRFRAPYPLLHGLLQLFCSKSIELRNHAEKLARDNIKYPDYALPVFSIQETEADSYAAVKVGVREWIVRRVGIITDKARTVTADSEGLKCSCLHFEECGIICRHIHCVARQDARFCDILTKPCIKLWENSNFINVFEHFEVLMPSHDEICATSGDMFPGPFGIPKRVAQRGRPRVKRFKMGHTFQFKRKMRGQASQAAGRQCSVCLRLGHNKTACPVRNRFKL